MNRNNKTIKMTSELLACKLNLKDNVDIIDVRNDNYTGVVEFLLKSNSFEGLDEGSHTPQVDFKDVIKDERLYSDVITAGLSYEEAQSAMKQGAYITRAIWEGYWHLEKIKGFNNPIIVAYLKGTGEKVPAQPYQQDLLANDWMIVLPKGQSIADIKAKERKYLPSVCVDILKMINVSAPDGNGYQILDDIIIRVFQENAAHALRPIMRLLAHEYVTINQFHEGELMKLSLTNKGKDHLRWVEEEENN